MRWIRLALASGSLVVGAFFGVNASGAGVAEHAGRGAGRGAGAPRVASLVPGGVQASGCPRGMAPVSTDTHAFCIDRWEAALVDVLSSGGGAGGGGTAPHSPFEPVGTRKVKAISAKGVTPQGYISALEAKAACELSDKRLCAVDEWTRACMGKNPTTYPYGDDEESGRCNTVSRDGGRGHPVVELFAAEIKGGADPFKEFAMMNDPRINQLPGTLSRTGAKERCKSTWGVYDMVGNLHEWTADPNGQFRGGYYMDTHKNGDGCNYKTTAHVTSYRDYSTGFRCCK
jgi:formylglycine-generating enzyme